MASTNLKMAATWGSWSFDPVTLTLVLSDEGRVKYSIPLTRMISSARMLDVIFDIRSKTWATSAIVGDLISAFRDLVDPQANLCRGGEDQALDLAVHLDRFRG